MSYGPLGPMPSAPKGSVNHGAQPQEPKRRDHRSL